jgi:hypothetical protein
MTYSAARTDSEECMNNRWIDLMRLAKECPATVNNVTITGNARRLLWCLVYHVDTETDANFCSMERLQEHVGCSPADLWDAAQNLKAAGLVAENIMNSPMPSLGVWTINRTLLEKKTAIAREMPSHEPK